MSDAAPLKMVSASRAWKAQVVLGLLAVFAFAFWSLALDALYGLAIGLVNVAMLSWTFQKANVKAVESPKSGIQILYLSAVIRFVLLAVLFVLGLQAFELNPMPVVLTFVVMQIGQMLNLKGKQRLTD
jgi:ATP synthase protein I